MQDLWDEEYTDLCRENFINAMYKFPETPVTDLENGREMPILGVGTWLKQNVQETIEQALRAGFRSARFARSFSPLCPGRILKRELAAAYPLWVTPRCGLPEKFARVWVDAWVI